MRILLFISIALLLFSCKKDKLEGDYAILQGKWQWIGASEVRENKVSGNTTSTWIPASNYATNYFFEFERKGKLIYWENEKEVKEFRVNTSLYKNDFCNDLVNCQYISIYLNNDQNKSVTIFMNEDTMRVVSSHLNIPLKSFEDNIATYDYIHIYKRIN